LKKLMFVLMALLVASAASAQVLIDDPMDDWSGWNTYEQAPGLPAPPTEFAAGELGQPTECVGWYRDFDRNGMEFSWAAVTIDLGAPGTYLLDLSLEAFVFTAQDYGGDLWRVGLWTTITPGAVAEDYYFNPDNWGGALWAKEDCIRKNWWNAWGPEYTWPPETPSNPENVNGVWRPFNMQQAITTPDGIVQVRVWYHAKESSFDPGEFEMVAFDNYRLEVVPEPASILAMFAGFAGLAGVIRRKK